MENKEELQLTLEGLNCANCARKIEEKVGKMEGVKESNLNFTTTTLNVKLERKVKEEHAINEIKKIVEALEPHVKVEKKVSGKTNVQRAKFEVKPTLIIGTILYLIAVIGDFVTIFTHSVVIGDIRIVNNVTIGASTMVYKDVPDNCVVIGNPARIIRQDGQKVNIKL